jgi:hypothetical protein
LPFFLFLSFVSEDLILENPTSLLTKILLN